LAAAAAAAAAHVMKVDDKQRTNSTPAAHVSFIAQFALTTRKIVLIKNRNGLLKPAEHVQPISNDRVTYTPRTYRIRTASYTVPQSCT